MARNPQHKICLVPQLKGLGGTASFQARLTNGLSERGIDFTYDPSDREVDVILVVGGTRRFKDLSVAHRRGVLIIQRLDGINWIHRQQFTGIQHFIRAELNNWLISTIRSRFANRIVYQSQFVKDWWNTRYGDQGIPDVIIHNGVDLKQFSPHGSGKLPLDHYRLLLVEGRLGGGYHLGLDNAVQLTRQLQERYHLPVCLRVVGEVPDSLKRIMDGILKPPIEWVGVVKQNAIPELDRSAHVLFSADLNAACPNSVIEALACGLPIIAFNTGAINELVIQGSGRIVPYGGDVWRLDPPDISSLADAAVDVFVHNPKYRHAARAHAVKCFSLDNMVDSYCKFWDSL